MILLHMGALHPIEKGLTLALAFGPFLVLAVVILLRRRQDARDDQSGVDQSDQSGPVDPGAQRER